MDLYASKRKAWQQTQSLYAVRVCGMTPSDKLPATDFPAQEVADATEFPKSEHVESHKWAFKQLHENFERKWSEWAGREK